MLEEEFFDIIIFLIFFSLKLIRFDISRVFYAYLADGTGNHMEVLVACSLNLPSKTSSISSSLNEHMADP